MRFFSDNAAAAHPAVLEAIAASNRLDTAYDGDAWSARLDGAFSDLFGTPVKALWVTTGTAANCLGLAALCPPQGAILCHEFAHIEQDEAGAERTRRDERELAAEIRRLADAGAKIFDGARELVALGRDVAADVFGGTAVSFGHCESPPWSAWLPESLAPEQAARPS